MVPEAELRRTGRCFGDPRHAGHTGSFFAHVRRYARDLHNDASMDVEQYVQV